MAETKASIWDELRKPFPAGTVSILPKPYKKDSPKGKCSECGGYHGLPAVHLDYVGHAAVTDRLNNVVGPENWNWEPMATDERGLPLLDRDGNLWIFLVINQVRKPGVGDGQNMKERIGDAIRNAAMRFGVALDLWSKDELESTLDKPELKNEKPLAIYNPHEFPHEDTVDISESEGITTSMITKLGGQLKLKGIVDRDKIMNILNNLAKTKGGDTIKDISLFQGNQLYDQIRKTDKEALEMLEAE